MANWSKREDEIMREVYPARGAKECGVALMEEGYARTYGAIKERAKNLGIKRTKPRVYDSSWTDDEIAIVCECYPSLGAVGVQKVLWKNGYERTVAAITTRANMLHLKTTNTRRRMQKAGDTRILNICLDTELDADVIGHLEGQSNRSRYIRDLIRENLA